MATDLGYDPSFLSVLTTGPPPVPLPVPAGAPDDVRELSYTHFTVLLHRGRRLAAATAVNVDGARLVDVERSGLEWRLDPRVPADQQAGDELYRDNDLDRGHLVRRRDPVWGDLATATAANVDTFVYPNAAPQVAAFNQSTELWLGLEDHVLGHAEATASRLSVFTGPVLADADPVYRGVALPRRFWKAVAWARGGTLAATAFVLDQGELLDRLLQRESAAGPEAAPGDLGAFRTFQVTVAEVESAASVDLGPLAAADRLLAAGPRSQGTPVLLASVADIVL